MDIMVDIETLASTSNAVIVQIAAVAFYRYSGEIHDKFKINIDPQSCVDLGLEMNVETIEWWFKQDEDAKRSILSRPRYIISEGLANFSKFIYENHKLIHRKDLFDPNDVVLWCHATFD